MDDEHPEVIVVYMFGAILFACAVLTVIAWLLK